MLVFEWGIEFCYKNVSKIRNFPSIFQNFKNKIEQIHMYSEKSSNSLEANEEWVTQFLIWQFFFFSIC